MFISFCLLGEQEVVPALGVGEEEGWPNGALHQDGLDEDQGRAGEGEGGRPGKEVSGEILPSFDYMFFHYMIGE